MLKGAVVGRPSIVFTRYHEAGVTRLRSHRTAGAAGLRLCKRILGYDTNTFYLSTMLREMPYRKERVFHYRDSVGPAQCLTQCLKDRTWFGFADVDIEIPKPLWQTFEDICPFFYNKEVPVEAVPQHMLDYLGRTGRDGKKLVRAPSAEKLPLYTLLLRWYVEHGAVIKAVYQLSSYQDLHLVCGAGKGGSPTGDVHVEKSKKMLADVFKLLGNSGYGKLIEAMKQQHNVIYTKDEKVVDIALRSTYFSDLDELGQAYELESRKPWITIRRLFQIDIAVYQLAKLRMLEFYYDFLDKYFDHQDFELIQMDTDSNYIAISVWKKSFDLS